MAAVWPGANVNFGTINESKDNGKTYANIQAVDLIIPGNWCNQVSDEIEALEVGLGPAATPTFAGEYINGVNSFLSIQSSGSNAMVGLARYHNSAIACNLFAYKSRHGTIGSHTIVQNGDYLFDFTANASDGTNFIEAGKLTFSIDGVPGSNDMPGKFAVWTTADGASSATERFSVNNAGVVTIGPTSTAGSTFINGFSFEIGAGQSADYNCYIDFHTAEATYLDYSMRFIRNSGANGAGAITHRGTGTFFISLIEAATFQIDTNNVGRFNVGSTGVVTISNLTASRAVFTDGSSNLVSASAAFSDISGLAATDGNIIVGNGTTWVAESGATARTSLGLGSGDSPTFVGVIVTDASSSIWQKGTNLINLTLDQYSNNVYGSSIYGRKSRNATIGSHTIVQDNDYLFQIGIYGSDGTNWIQGARITASIDGTPGTNDMPTRLSFWTTADGASSATENMALRPNGRLAVDKYIAGGTLNPPSPVSTQGNNHYLGQDGTSWILWMENNHATPEGLLITFDTAIDNNTQAFLYCYDGTARCIIYSDGDVVNHDGTYGTISDSRLKRNIRDARDYTDDICKLRVRKYESNCDMKGLDRLGFVAQEFEEVFPRLVGYDASKDMKFTKDSHLVPMLVTAVQALVRRIKVLEGDKS